MPPKKKPSSSSSSSLPSIASQLLSSGKYSDLTLLCQGQEFKVHKNVVCMQSSNIAAAIDGGFKEAQTGTYEIKEFDAESVRRMVEFMYKGNYEVIEGEKTSEGIAEAGVAAEEEDDTATELPTLTTLGSQAHHPNAGDYLIDAPINASFAMASLRPQEAEQIQHQVSGKTLLAHVEMNRIGGYYLIPTLQEVANEKLKNLLENRWSADGFMEILVPIIESVDPALHDLISMIATSHIEDLAHHPEFQKSEIMNDLIANIIQKLAVSQKAMRVSSAEKIVDFQARLWDLEEKLANEKSQHQAQISKTARVIQRFENCIEKLRDMNVCPGSQCTAEFRCNIVRMAGTSVGMGEPLYMIHCTRCSWKTMG